MTDVLLIGSGGREHALAQALTNSAKLGRLHIAPGNAGTAKHNVILDVDSNLAVIDYCDQHNIDLVVVGPEGPLVAGLADDLALAGIACFGPSAAAAQIEGSKSFARKFANRHGIPSPRSSFFNDVEEAIKWLETFGDDVVVKADGLAAGKGVVVPESRVEAERAIYEILADHSMGSAGDSIVLEERMVGEEVSLFGIADGLTVTPLITAQDHKRVGEGNTGLNTGGMGAFAPVPGITHEVQSRLASLFLEPMVNGMAKEGNPYVGIVYAGIMLTEAGPKLVEYNCRFGDPEAQAILPLIDSDVLEMLEAAANGRLSEVEIEVRDETAVAVVLAADGYPAKPRLGVRVGDAQIPDGAKLFHAGTGIDDEGQLVSTGGRVLNAVGIGADLSSALQKAYAVADQLTGDGLFARSDIGWRHAPRPSPGGAYASAGVSLEAAHESTQRISAAVEATHDERVIAGLGSFGGVFDLASLARYDSPLLVATTDGVGTKSILSAELDRWEGCGADIVNHCIDDLLVQGASPLFFMDTVAASDLEPEVLGRIVEGMSAACQTVNCVLLGGETAEMPDVLAPGAVDVSGTMVGVVERSKLLPTDAIAPGHMLIGLASSGLHTNGYSLARKVFADHDLNDPMPGGHGETIGDALLAVHRNYHGVLSDALSQNLIDGLVHITGGGFIDNIPRILPAGCGAVVDTKSWTRPVLFNYMIARAGISEAEAHQVFNCGIGMIAVVSPDLVDEVQAAIPEETWVIGELNIGGGVELR